MSAHLREGWRKLAVSLDWPAKWLYRGESKEGLIRLLQGGLKFTPPGKVYAEDYGQGLYFATTRSLAEGYGPMILKCGVKSGGRILDATALWPAGVIDHSNEWLNSCACHPGGIKPLALSLGYQGVSDGEVVAIYDLSILEVEDFDRLI